MFDLHKTLGLAIETWGRRSPERNLPFCKQVVEIAFTTPGSTSVFELGGGRYRSRKLIFITVVLSL